ncbi:MAG: helix-turn-helix transcriptional regulator [Pseudobutyrivibrio sp.]|nr:helix-turn-helix transcriptional regulator [Pseudobutyrivibrio sp.]
MKTRYPTGIIPPPATVTRQDLARELKTTRKELNITQETLAQMTGTKKSNISRLESGKYNPSLDFLVKIASALGKSLDITLK